MKSVHFAARHAGASADGSNVEAVVASLVGKFAQVGAALAAATAIALLVGFIGLDNYYRRLGATWVIAMIPPSQMIANGAWVSIGIVVVSLFMVISLSEKKVTPGLLRKLSSGLIGLSAVPLLLTLNSFTWPSPSLKYYSQIVAGVLVVLASGLAAGELVGRLAESKLRWKPIHTVICLGIVGYGLFQAPQHFAWAAARKDTDRALSALPIVQTSEVLSPERSWRLVGVFDKSALVMTLADDPKDREFRLISTNELVKIGSESSAL